ncbi:hypothetical protein ACTHQ4_02210 [Alkalicoccobacillus gibsonii]|uniref:hypothetical protein n=1 Tax=Alkalicoccobacillus gibsonii TaxID=79881 RepID=UPI003F7CB5D2
MKAAEATKLAQLGGKNVLSNTIQKLEMMVLEACNDGKPSVSIEMSYSWEKVGFLSKITDHFEKDDFDVFVDGDYLTVYWGLEDSEIDGH